MKPEDFKKYKVFFESSKSSISKDLNSKTYSFDIRFWSLFNFDIRFEGLRLIPSKTAVRELQKHELTLNYCKFILENGYSYRRRKSNIIEKCLDKEDRTYVVVAAKSFSYFHNEEVNLIIHIGKISRKVRK